LLNFPLISAVLAGVVAIAALLKARATATRLRQMTESYWELRYESGQLKSRVARLEVQAGLREPPPDTTAPAAKTTFVPLSTLKK
jgi:hypothetical protein